MIVRAALLLLLLTSPLSAAETGRIVYIGIEDDPYYKSRPFYTGLALRDIRRPIEGARLGLRDSRVLARALGVTFELVEVMLDTDQPVTPAIRAAKGDGALAILLDLPEDKLEAVVTSEGGDGLLINVRSRHGRWRGENCAKTLLHTIPSEAMLSDALAQYLRSRGWRDILLLHGETPNELRQLRLAQRSIAKFGLNIVGVRPFELSNNPRQRDRNNVALLTGGVSYDVIWLIDSVGEFGRYVPFSTYAPRPIVGTEGLVARAWHWTLERYGAPQLNQRFTRRMDRHMTSEDWAGWAATRAIISAVSAIESIDAKKVQAALRAGNLNIDLYKGVRGTFRDWNGQMRQPILLTTHNAVVAIAPLEGFEHQTDALDTLGIDRAESECEER